MTASSPRRTPPRTFRPWPRGLAGQTIALLLLALVGAQVATTVLFFDERRQAVLLATQNQVFGRIASVARLLRDTPRDLHDDVAHAASAPNILFWIADKVEVETRDGDPPDPALRRRLDGLLSDVAAGPVVIGFTDGAMPFRDRWRRDEDARRRMFHWRDRDSPRDRPWERSRDDDRARDSDRGDRARDSDRGDRARDSDRGDRARDSDDDRRKLPARPRFLQPFGLAAAVPLDGGRWLNVATQVPPPPFAWALSTLVSVGLTALAVIVIVILMVRRIARPLGNLAAAADRLGRGESLPPLAERGPDEVVRATRAFNRMNDRLHRFVADRTRLLAALSHDLRTPITALRLRAEFIEDEETRRKILETLDEMQQMAESTLAFAREEATREDSRAVDLAALVESLCEDLKDLGLDITWAPAPRTPATVRPVAIKRALRNLIENACTYGTRARVRLEPEGDGLRITIDDDGPGMPEDQMERLFEPFVRLETSRSRDTGGIGLGLSIARTIVRGHGGDITVENRPNGDGDGTGGVAGLSVTVHLPLGTP